MKVKSGYFTLSCVAALLLLQGCTSSFNSKYSGDDMLRKDSPGLQDLEQQKQQAFSRYQTAFLGKQVVYSAKQQHLLAKPVVFRSEIPMSLEMVLSSIAAQTSSSFRINEQAPGADAAKAADGGSAVKDQTVNFSGTFEEFMRYLSALYDVSVSLEDDNILLVTVYKTYAIKLDYFGDNSYESGLDLSGNEAASSGGVKGKYESTFQSTFWTDVDTLAKKYVSSGVYNLFKDVGVLTFSGRPSEYQTLSRILRDYKKDNSKQFVITYKVFILDKDKVKQAGGELGAAFKKGGTAFAINSGIFENPGTGIAVARKFSDNLSVAAKLDALYNLTGSKMLQSGTMVTRNNTPVPLNLTRSRNYVSGVTIARGDQSSNFVNSAITTSTVTTGTSVILTPHVLSDGRVQITSAYTKKDLIGEPDVFPKGASASQNQVQLPKIATTELYNTVDVIPGSLIVVGQYDEKNDSDTRDLKLLGASFKGTDHSSTVVMVIGIDYYNKPFEADH